MKLVDANVLFYAVHRQAAQHGRMKQWLESALSGDEPIGLAWIAVVAFIRLSTRAGVFQIPLSAEESIDLVDKWIALPNVRLVNESDEHWRILRESILQVGTAGNLTTDAHLAALAIAHGATVVSCDTDFSRFRQVRWENPLA